VEESKDDSKFESTVIMNAVLDVVKKYLNDVPYNGRNLNQDRIFNMALTSDQISEAYDTLS
jgi:hypothetical protein